VTYLINCTTAPATPMAILTNFLNFSVLRPHTPGRSGHTPGATMLSYNLHPQSILPTLRTL
jgi:hypothetical protein